MKNKKYENIINMLFIICLLFTLTYSFTYTFKIGLFKINEIEILGNQYINQEDISNIIKNDIENSNIYNIKLEEIKNKIENHSFIKNVKTYTGLPSSISIIINEINPIVLYQMDNDYYLIDDRYEIIKADIEAINFFSVPIISGHKSLYDNDYKKVVNSLKHIANNNNQLYNSINEIKIKDEYMFLIINNTTVKIKKDNMNNNISKLMEFVNKTNDHKSIKSYKYINLAIPNQIIVKDKII